MLGRSSTSTSFRRVNVNTDEYAPVRIKKVEKASGVSAMPIQHLRKEQIASPNVHVEGSSAKVEKRVVFMFSLYSTMSKSISRASTRKVVVFAEPAGPVRTSRRCNIAPSLSSQVLNTGRRRKDPRGASSDLSHQMPPLATYERHRPFACVLLGPAATAAHIYPPRGGRLKQNPVSLKRSKKQMRHADRFVVRITAGSLSLSLNILGDHADSFSWLRSRRRSIRRTGR